jgi:Fur family transcriptional regulator, ferric uptake regulator
MPSNPQPLSIDQVAERLRSAGLRRTLSRVQVAQFLSECRVPPTHAEIADALVRFGFDTSTIFRTLNHFVQHRLVSRFDVGDHTWRYSLRRDADADNSGTYAICMDCKAVKWFETTASILSDADRRHWQIEEILVKGRCPACRPGKKRRR